MSAARRELLAERVHRVRERLAHLDTLLADLEGALAAPGTERIWPSAQVRALLPAVGRELLDLSTAFGASTGELRASAAPPEEP